MFHAPPPTHIKFPGPHAVHACSVEALVDGYHGMQVVYVWCQAPQHECLARIWRDYQDDDDYDRYLGRWRIVNNGDPRHFRKINRNEAPDAVLSSMHYW